MGKIFNITRFCTDDGPGIRTTVFLKGCPLRCIWCHNPESQNPKNEIMLSYEKCKVCSICSSVCPSGLHNVDVRGHRFERERCTLCGECVKVCPESAIEIYGKDMTAKEVMSEVVRDKIFYETSGGGLTVSGGEPLYQGEFTEELLSLARGEGIRTAIETSGFGGKEITKRVFSLCDLILFDLKETDEKRHKAYTGVDLAPILDNLRLADEIGCPITLRLPVIPGLNDREEHFEKVAEIARSLKNLNGVQVMPYHILGEYKYRQLDRKYECRGIREPDGEIKRRWQEYFSEFN